MSKPPFLAKMPGWPTSTDCTCIDFNRCIEKPYSEQRMDFDGFLLFDGVW